jgi:hypothetical protein
MSVPECMLFATIVTLQQYAFLQLHASTSELDLKIDNSATFFARVSSRYIFAGRPGIVKSRLHCN